MEHCCKLESISQEQLAQDPYRPRYHYHLPSGCLSDPNGLIQWKGEYHLFHQYDPDHAWRARQYWGHAVSKDLVHWTRLPIALTPDPEGPDRDGCFSGCAVDNDGVPTLIYTGNQRRFGKHVFSESGKVQTQCIATSTDGMVTWGKYAENPVLSWKPEGTVPGFRDPYIWREDDAWHMIVGAGFKDTGGTALMYRSADLIHWDYLHPLCDGDPTKISDFWEVPNLFPLGNKHVLTLNTHGLARRTFFFVGTYADHRFTPERECLSNPVDSFVAPQTLLDEHGRRIMWAWVQPDRLREADVAAGWSGIMSLPRVLSLGSNGELLCDPVPELQPLRGKHQHFADISLGSESGNILGAVQGDSLEIIAEFDPGDARKVGLKVRCSPDGHEQTIVSYDPVAKQLSIDRILSSLNRQVGREFPEIGRDLKQVPLELAASERLKLHVFLDRSVVELFGNSRACIVSMIYPSRADSLGMRLFAFGGTARLVAMDIWEMDSIWTD